MITSLGYVAIIIAIALAVTYVGGMVGLVLTLVASSLPTVPPLRRRGRRDRTKGLTMEIYPPLPNRPRCPVCRTTGTTPHEPGSEECLLIAEERRLSQSDWN